MMNLLGRGVEAIYPSREGLEALLQSGRKLSVYLGIDPTGPNLHLGHGVLLRKLKAFADAGHRTILVLGDFTAMIGDPSGKKTSRCALTEEEVKANLKNYHRQLEKILDLKKTEIVSNSQWLAKLSLAEVVKLASEFTVAQMLERDMFAERQKRGEPIYLHELLYPLMQGYDSVALEVDIEIGGSDQTFNMLVGRTMLKRQGKEKFVLTLKLLTDPTGKKMGKTEGNLVTLTDSPQEMYGKIMSWPDSLIEIGAELCTGLPLEEMKALTSRDPLAAKKKLAKEIVRIYHNEEVAFSSETIFAVAFQEQGVPENLAEITAQAGEQLADVLLRAGAVASKSEFRRLVAAGAIFNLENQTAISDSSAAVTAPLILRIGKKRFVKIVLK
jgi:tyrosyl-tRNA synthetase